MSIWGNVILPQKDGFIYGANEPGVPCLWFNTVGSEIPADPDVPHGMLLYRDSDGVLHPLYPMTTIAAVYGLDNRLENLAKENKGYVDTAVRKAAPRNILDNSDFTNLVAQAGIGGNHGTIAYAADRWILDSGTVSYEAGVGLTLNGTIRQKLEFPPTGETSVFVGMASGEASISYADGAVTITSSGGVLKWAALYVGVYSAATMPEYQPKGYGAELVECQRYFVVLATYILFPGFICWGNINFSVPLARMRTDRPTLKNSVNPTIVVNGKYIESVDGLNASGVFSTNGTLYIQIPTSAFASYDNRTVAVLFRNEICVSADL